MKKHTLMRVAIFLLLFFAISIHGKSQTLIHNFEFNNSLNDTKNTGISLTSVNTATSSFQSNPNGWTWTQPSSPGGGLELLTDELTDPTSYSIGFRVSYTQTSPSWRKILSFNGPSDDNGFYFNGGRLQFYPTATLSTSTYSPNTFYDFIMTRNATGLVNVYIVETNGTVNQVFSIQDNQSTTVPRLINGNYEFRFFMDDIATTSEFTSGGTVRSIRLWDAPLNPSQIGGALGSVITNDATNITTNSAMLNGEVNPQGVSSTFEFEYGTTTAYGSTITATPSSSAATSAIPVSANLTGLQPGVTYHYRLKANATSTNTDAFGGDKTFTTNLPPATGLNFDGVDDFIQATPISNTSAITVEAWIKPTFKSDFSAIVSTKTAGFNENGFLFAINEFNNPSGNLLFETFEATTVSTVSVNWGSWQHVAFTYDGSTTKMFINGIEVPTTKFPSSGINLQPSLNNALIGDLTNYLIGNAHYLGDMDEVRIWSTARTDQEIMNNKDCELTGSEPGLVAYYNFDNGVVGGTNTGLTTLADQTSNGNDGTLQNFALSGATSNWVEGVNLPNTCTSTCATTNSFGPTKVPNGHVQNGALTINADYDAAGANADDTYYWGLSSGKITANPTGGTAPYTYNWYSKDGYMVRGSSNQTARLWYPTGPTWVVVEITDDGGNGCTVKDSIYVDWVDFTCNQPLIWWYQLCDNNTNITLCVQGTSNMTSLVSTGNYSFGTCTSKSNNLTGANSINVGLMVYPNPSNDVINMNMPITNASSGRINLIDMNGRVLYAESVQLNEGTFEHYLNVSEFANGVYSIQIISDNEIFTKRIVIQH
jgi:hypothetical protein